MWTCGFEVNLPTVLSHYVVFLHLPGTNIFFHNKYNFNPIMSEIITIGTSFFLVISLTIATIF